MTDIDLDALQATNGIQIPLIDGAVRVRSVAVTGAAKQGFAAISAVALRVSVPMLRGEGGPSVTVTVQKSSNGSAWSTAHAFTFTTSGEQEFVLDDPLDYLRVVCTPGGGLREAVVGSVFAVPQFVDPPAGAASLPSGGTTGQVLTKASDTDGDADWEDASGGSQPGTARLFGPYTVTHADVPANNDKFTLFTPGIGDGPPSGGVIIEFAVDPYTAVNWDVGDYLELGQNVADSPANYWGYVDPLDIIASETNHVFANLKVAGADFVQGHYARLLTDDPVEVLFLNGGATPSAGSVSFYFLIAEPTT